MKPVVFDHVTYAYASVMGKKQLALDAVSLSIEEGESLGFVGQNGAGKSTAIKLLLGFIRTHQGTVLLNGLAPSDNRSRRSVGYVPEVASLPPTLTPREILAMGQALRFGESVAHAKEVDGLLERLDIADVIDKRVRDFSKGMSQRVAIALALVGNPKLLVLDEPLSGLDPKGRADVVSLLAEYQRKGSAIFFSSHVLHDVERLADRVALLHHGRIHAIHDVESLLRQTEGNYVIRYAGPLIGTTAQMVRHGICQLACSQTELASKVQEIERVQGKILELKSIDSLETRFLNMVKHDHT